MSVRESTFTLSIEPALRRMAEEGRPARVAAFSTGVRIADVRLWLAEFNNSSEELTLARLNEVKHELGILAERRLAPEELPQKGAEGAKTEEPTKPAKDAKPEAEGIFVPWGKPLAATKHTGGTKSKAADSARNGGAVDLPWKSVARPRVLARAAIQWAPVLRLYLADSPPADIMVQRAIARVGVTPSCWQIWRRKTFGAVENFTPGAIAEFLARHGLLTESGEVKRPLSSIIQTDFGAVPVHRSVFIEPEVAGAPLPRPLVGDGELLERVLGEVTLLAQAWRDARISGWTSVIIRRALREALAEASAQAGREGA